MNRKRIIAKHSPVLTKIDPRAPLSVGNGDFGFVVDFTGLQTFPDTYITPLNTLSNWGWHSTGGKDRYRLKDTAMQTFDNGKYPLFPEKKEEAYHWLRQNPHRIPLGQLGFRFTDQNNQVISQHQVKPIRQELDMWTGVIKSKFAVENEQVFVQTACDPKTDTIAVTIESELLKQGRIGIELAFPSPEVSDREWENAISLVWKETGHFSKQIETSSSSSLIERKMDDSYYLTKLDWKGFKGKLVKVGQHVFQLNPDATSSFSFTMCFAESEPEDKDVDQVFQANDEYWSMFWQEGGFVSFEGSKDRRAEELERRVILSQYLTAIHSAGSLPPQETGFMYNSWFGKFHLEMHWWHGAHFPLWNRVHLLNRSMDWYMETLPEAIALAESQGYRGARWPKMVAKEGKQTPSPIAPGLIWQQPHILSLAELCYQANPTMETLKLYKELVIQTAEFMVSFARFDRERNNYQLGPGLIPAQECHAMEESLNPTFELEYWYEGLNIVIRWMHRLGEEVPKEWIDVRDQLTSSPVENGVYLAHQNCNKTFQEKNYDHPSMVGALGVLSGERIDRSHMLATLKKVQATWNWESAWGWDFPMCAMTATYLGEKELAIEFLLMDQVKNTYLVNGHNYQHDALTAYLPGNGGLLIAIARMIATNGFPEGWRVRAEQIANWIP
ncbi:glycoside hydrolase family 65 [Gracilibacillus dipsosauri]|uniref:glycoside hydrolase family 65 n=1 Tax=Gracilibacillus dipsosauri TaxID=178340 RepID=UPI002409B4D6